MSASKPDVGLKRKSRGGNGRNGERGKGGDLERPAFNVGRG